MSPFGLAYKLEATNNWNLPLMALAGIYAAAAVAWLMIDPERRVEKANHVL